MAADIYPLLRQLLFLLPAEASHDLSLKMLSAAGGQTISRKLMQQLWGNRAATAPIELMGLSLPNPVGLAAGLDKQGTAASAFHALGFGFVECGTVTPQPQPGNAKPRLFRLAADQAIINRMGFNSIGAAAFVKNVQHRLQSLPTNERGVVGLNIGKNATTPIDRAVTDYLTAMEMVYPYADYISVNISSPNTKNLRDLQGGEAMEALLHALIEKRKALADQYGQQKPIAVKVAPDLETADIDAIARLLLQFKIDGLIATNTTIHRPDTLTESSKASEAGGLSGAPLRDLATHAVAEFAQRLQGEVSIIAAGGIDSGTAAKEKIQAGADAVQIYTGLIYHGPRLIHEIVNDLSTG